MMWRKIFLLLLISNIIIILVSVLRANFADNIKFSFKSFFDPTFWLKNPPLLLILGLCGLWFFFTMLASQSASVASQARLTASIYIAVSMALNSVFTLINLMVYQVFRKEVVTSMMWLWVSVATLCIVISSVAWYMFIIEGQKAIIA